MGYEEEEVLGSAAPMLQPVMGLPKTQSQQNRESCGFCELKECRETNGRT